MESCEVTGDSLPAAGKPAADAFCSRHRQRGHEALRKSCVVTSGDALISVNLPFSAPPRPLNNAMIASEMPSAINPYSMAVAPDSSFQNFKTKRFM